MRSSARDAAQRSGRAHFTRFPRDKAIILRCVDDQNLEEVRGVYAPSDPWAVFVPIDEGITGLSKAKAASIQCWDGSILADHYEKRTVTEDGREQVRGGIKQRFRMLFWNYETADVEVVESGFPTFRGDRGILAWLNSPNWPDSLTQFDLSFAIKRTSYGDQLLTEPCPANQGPLPKDIQREVDKLLPQRLSLLEWKEWEGLDVADIAAKIQGKVIEVDRFGRPVRKQRAEVEDFEDGDETGRPLGRSEGSSETANWADI